MNAKVQIKCRNIWKIFGADPAGFPAKHNENPSPDVFKAEGYIGACQDVSFDFHAGESLIIMGLSGSGKSTMADRIGIMKDGRMVQLATPEEIVLHPADDYVAEFARNAPHQRIISVGAMMEPVTEGSEDEVSVDAKIGDVAEQVLRADKPIGVVDAEGRLVGSLNRGDIATALFSRETA